MGPVYYRFQNQYHSNTHINKETHGEKRVKNLKQSLKIRYGAINKALDKNRELGLRLSALEGLITDDQMMYLLGSKESEFRAEYSKMVHSTLDKLKADILI